MLLGSSFCYGCFGCGLFCGGCFGCQVCLFVCFFFDLFSEFDEFGGWYGFGEIVVLSCGNIQFE